MVFINRSENEIAFILSIVVMSWEQLSQHPCCIVHQIWTHFVKENMILIGILAEPMICFTIGAVQVHAPEGNLVILRILLEPGHSHGLGFCDLDRTLLEVDRNAKWR